LIRSSNHLLEYRLCWKPSPLTSHVDSRIAQINSRIYEEPIMNGTRVTNYRVEGAKYGISFGSALAIAISYSNNHSVFWAIIDGILSWIYVIFFVLFR
jgi:hypothetical protein